jgi:hypothetical protein
MGELNFSYLGKSLMWNSVFLQRAKKLGSLDTWDPQSVVTDQQQHLGICQKFGLPVHFRATESEPLRVD